MRSKRKKIKKLPIIFLILDLLSSIILNILVISLNAIPILYIIIIDFLLLVIFGLSIILITRRQKPLKVFGVIISSIIILMSSIGSYYLYKTHNFMNKSFNNDKNVYTSTYYVLTNNNKYSDIKDIEGKTLGYYKDLPNLNKALNKLTKKVDVKEKDYETIIPSFAALDNNEIEALLMEKTIYDSLVESIETIKNKNYTILYKFDIKIEEVVKKKESKSNAVNIYIGGADFTEVNNDFNMVVTVNKDTHKILLTSIPRDYYVTIPSKGMKDILGYAGVWGINTSRETVENLFGIDINYYVKINTNSLVGLVDTLGGIEFCSDISYTTTHALIQGSYDDSKGKKLKVEKGCKKYSGIEILTIARERKAFPDGDRQRQKNCQAIIISIFKKVASPDTIMNYTNVLNAVNNLYTTNIESSLVTEMAKTVLNGANWTFEQQSVTGRDGRGNVHLNTVADYVMNPNQESVDEAISKIKSVMEGK